MGNKKDFGFWGSYWKQGVTSALCGSSAEVGWSLTSAALLLGSSWQAFRDFSFRTHCRLFNDAAVAEVQVPSCSTSVSPVATHPNPQRRHSAGDVGPGCPDSGRLRAGRSH